MSNIFNNDIKLFVNNLNNELDKNNKLLTLRKRKIDFKQFYYYLIKYNLNPDSSYTTTNIDIFNNNEANDVSYQAYVNKRNNFNISTFENINNIFLSSLYKHIESDEHNNNKFKYKIKNTFYRLIACDGSQLNFLYSLNNKLKSNKHNTYTYANLSCLYDVELKIPINYMMSNDNERKLLTKQLGYLNNNDILIADRGYYSIDLAEKLNENKINFVLRISRHVNFYIDNLKVINESNEGTIDIFNNNKSLQMKLFWYKTYKDVDKDIEKIILLINKIKNEIDVNNNKLITESTEYNNLHVQNKSLLEQITLNKLNENKKIVNEKMVNKKININRKEKKRLKINIDTTKNKIKLLKKELKNLYEEKKEIELKNNSKYYIVTNLLDIDINQIKEIHKKRWCVETHFKFSKELTKLDLIDNKNYEYIKQNLLITQFIFLISGYIQYILNKQIKKNSKLNITGLMTSLKNKLIYYLLKNDIKYMDEIIKILNKLIKCILKEIETIKFKKRIRKRPQKNYYNSNGT